MNNAAIVIIGMLLVGICTCLAYISVLRREKARLAKIVEGVPRVQRRNILKKAL